MMPGLAGNSCPLALVADMGAEELPALLDELCVEGTELVSVHDRPEGTELGRYHFVIELRHAGGFAEEELERIKGGAQVDYLGAYRSIEG